MWIKKFKDGALFGVVLALLVVGFMMFTADRGQLASEINTTRDNVAIEGYDTVAYFTEKKAVKGTARFSHSYKNAIWHFASAENRDRFASDPKRYAPQYGGY
jgi:YHS domain-containing protein